MAEKRRGIVQIFGFMQEIFHFVLGCANCNWKTYNAVAGPSSEQNPE